MIIFVLGLIIISTKNSKLKYIFFLFRYIGAGSSKFHYYFVYAVGLSTLGFFCACLLNNIETFPDEYKPNFGVNYCLYEVYNYEVSFIYVYGLILILTTVNVACFIASGVTVYKVRHELSAVGKRHAKHYER